MAHYSEAGGSASRLPGTLSLSAEYEQLKADYQASVEKLNQTMNSIKTFWSPELKRERQMRREVERLLQTAGPSSGVAQDAHLRMEIAARDEKIRQLNAMLDEGMSGGSGLADMRVRELEDMVAQLQEMLKNTEQQMLGQVVTLRMKMERSEVELSERKAELAQCQARMRTAEEQAADLRQHVQLLKEQITNREQQHTLLQGDVDALRQKLEGKNQQMEQRDQRIERLEKDLASAKGEVSEKNEQIQQSDHRISQMMGRIDGLETSLRDKEAELDKAKLRQLKCNVENLQKELADRDVLLESQNEKIGDMDRELASSRQRLQAVMTDKGEDELRRELADARRENTELRKRVAEGGAGEREQLLRAVEAERRQHIEQLLQLKQEALLAAIAEKDAHLALLEKSRAPREEIETVRRHREALMRKLKQENERRAMVVRPESAASVIQPGAATVAVGGPAPFISQPSPRQGDVMTMSAELDDSEGIWA
ncbi:hypothetical protein ANCDUO_15544 [Ancylostoma duodenale]|uniref:Uncharacterized protein n=1 Tax=Ancylostoma duodenale TaxID=51022 RepID=A0A0C2GBH9_9BILA|nr:hypothetical protein ANCDUO_15544 [Ancylostoma duodenale]